MVNDAGAEVDAITGLKAPTNFGRPNWDRLSVIVGKTNE
jgi:NADPH oxidase 2